MSFAEMGLAPTLLSALEETGFSTPTSVQAAAIPQALAGHDLMVSSQTGSGKTAAFMLPALHRIARESGQGGVGVQVLVLAPTRELALQVAEATQSYGRNLPGLRTATVVGGMPYGAQLKALSRRVDVLVATPGRLIDHLQAGRVKLGQVHTLVLDEADRMLDMGFIEDIETIVGRLPAERQTLLFSATLDGTVARLAARMMRDPQRIEVSGHRQKHTNITQSLLYADDAAHKMALLDHVLRDARLDQAIIFTATKRGADSLADTLADRGFAAAALHGDMNQRQRTRTLTQLQRGQVRVLVATDVAARGIDVQGISHAVNFDLPMQAEDYVHRIGRTGRAGRDGLAYTLATHAERHKVRRIEHYIGQSLTAEVIPGLEPRQAPRAGAPARHGKPGGKPYGKPQGKPFARPAGRPYEKREGGYAGPRHETAAPTTDSRPARGFVDRSAEAGPARPVGGEWARRAPRGDWRAERDQALRGERSPAERPARPGHERPAHAERAPREGGWHAAERAPRPAGEYAPRHGEARKPQDRPYGQPAGKSHARPAGSKPFGASYAKPYAKRDGAARQGKPAARRG
ncbi:DEAD/DEAH box helicase [Bordetella sp. 2513F-2]